jgi:hypothetical protein
MVEVIGLVISFLALLYLFMMQNRPVQRKERPFSDQDERVAEEDPFKEWMKAIEKKVTRREAPPPSKIKKQKKKPPPLPLEEDQIVSQIESRHLKSALEERHIQSRFNDHEKLPKHASALSISHHLAEEESVIALSRGQQAIQRLAKRRDLIIYQEIVNKPKSLRLENLP